MVRRFCPPRHFAARCARLWWAACALGVAVVAIGGCGVDRTGLQQVQLPDDAGNGTMVRGDAPADRTSVDGTGGQSGIDGVGGGAGDGGAASGGGGAGTGGAIGTGGVIGTGGMIGTGGAIGTGGMIGTGGIGTGGGPGDGGPGDGGPGDGGPGDGLGDGGPGGTPPGDGGVNGTGGVGDAGATTGTGGRGGAGGGPGAGCTPATCTNGCCAGATCITSLSAQQCGHGGGACQPCAPCDRCSVAGTCELDPTSLWDLWAVSAALNPIDPNIKAPASTTWDLDSGEVGGTLPDPFVELDILAQPVTTLGHTATIVDALFPNWTGLPTATQALLNPVAPLTASDLMGGRQWQIVVGDDDVGVASATSGETMCQIDGPLVPADFRNGTFTRIGVDSCFSATFRLTCHL